jgi:serine/threonine protein kinase
MYNVPMNLPKELQLGEVLYQTPDKPASSAILAGTYAGQFAIFKRGDSNHLRREEAILRTAHFEGIPSVLDYIEDGEHDFLVMERLAGTHLSKYIGLDSSWHSRELEIEEALCIVDGLALCFDALHKVGYLYRDLNLDHVIVNETKVGLVDHEWCVLADKAGWGRVDSRAGTWETMAHEEFRVGNRITRASNTYTLGVVLLQLTTRINPFFISAAEAPNVEIGRINTRSLHERLPDIQTTNIALDSMLNVALQPTPNRRYQSVTEFREALSRVYLNIAK